VQFFPENHTMLPSSPKINIAQSLHTNAILFSMNKDQIDKVNKQQRIFCDTALINHNKEGFLVALLSGGEVANYMLTPAHTKRLLISLNTQIKNYEQKFGEIDTNIPSPIPSPIQSSDLNKPPDDKNKK
jgi:hypothetical protein